MSHRPADAFRQDGKNRQVVWIPIVHTRQDMGCFQEKVESQYVRRMGRAKWDAHVKSVERLWDGIRRGIDELGLDFHGVRIYQDGLPVCAHEERIVRELASHGSLNHRLLVDLMDRGARLMGTESPQLLLEEYQLNRRILDVEPNASNAASRAANTRDEARRLLEGRDRFIASRIAETLQPGECGLVFLGMLHSLERRLPSDIRLTRLRPEDGSQPVPRRLR